MIHANIAANLHVEASQEGGISARLPDNSGPGMSSMQGPADTNAIADEERYARRLQDASLVAGRTAHAFDNVLTGIVGFAELTLTMCPAGSTQRQYLEEVLQAAQLGMQLTQELHQVSRSGSQRPGPSMPGIFLAEEAERFRARIAGKAQFQAVIAGDLPAVAIDADPLRAALDHLLANALESLPAGGTITLTAAVVDLSAADCQSLLGNPQPGRHVKIEVADSGSGLSAEASQKIFVEPFFTTKPRHRGIGLAVVYRTALVHHAGFRLVASPGGGTAAQLFLPVAAQRPLTPSSTASA